MSVASIQIDVRDFNRQVERSTARMRRTLDDYQDKDRAKVVRAGANAIAAAARRNPGFSDSSSPHYRGTGSNRITYNPGNLRRSLKRLPIKSRLNAFVGPLFARRKSTEYGKVGQPVDGYYAAMIFGSAAAFERRVLIPALRRGTPTAIGKMSRMTDKAIAQRARRRGINVR